MAARKVDEGSDDGLDEAGEDAFRREVEAASGRLTLGDPITCAGYPEPRVHIETVDWWIPHARLATAGDDFQHGHLGACYPYPESTVKGILNLDFRLQLHHNPSVVRAVKIHVNSALNVGTGGAGLSFRIPPGEMDASTIVPMKLDTTKYPDGRQLLRVLVAFEDPDGLQGRASLKFCLNFRNGKTVNSKSWPLNKVDAQGWYDFTGYAKADLLSAWPMAPVSGMWRPVVETAAMKDPITGDISPVIESAFVLDSVLHSMPPNPGTLLKKVAGVYKGPVDVDTTKLANGPHKFFIRARQKDVAQGRHAGVLIVPFTVAN